MNRKYKFPCSKHYTPKGLGTDGKSMYWTTEECNNMYVPTCEDCREVYKRPGNESLFNLPWWRYNYKLSWWLFAGGEYNLRKHFIWILKHKGIWKALKLVFWGRSHYDECQRLIIPFFEIGWRPLEFYDIQEGWIDLSIYYPEKPLTNPKHKEHNDITQHLTKVAYRYQRMWKKQLKEKLNCDSDPYWPVTCIYGTYGCAHHPKKEEKK